MAPTATAERKRTKKAGGKPARGRKPRERQSRLPGMERPSNPTIDRAADEYVEARDERMKLTQQEVALKENVRKLMKKHKRKSYSSAAVEITVEPPDGEDKIIVKAKKKKVTRLDADAD